MQENINVNGLPIWLQVVIGAAAFLSALAIAIRSIPPIWRFFEQIVSAVHQLVTLDDRLTAQDEQIADIHHETHNNNGSSIKDSVDRLELSIKDSVDRLERVEEGVAGLYERPAGHRED